jgi:hypothetical protein
MMRRGHPGGQVRECLGLPPSRNAARPPRPVPVESSRRLLLAVAVVMIASAAVAGGAPSPAVARSGSGARAVRDGRDAAPAAARRHRVARPASEHAPFLEIGEGSGVTGSREVVVHGLIRDGDATGREYELAEARDFTGTWSAWGDTNRLEVPFSLSAGDGEKVLDLRYRSSTGELQLSARVTLDTTAPSVSVSLDEGARVTLDRRLRLDTSVGDLTGPRRMSISTDGGDSWGSDRPFDARLPLDLPAGTRTGRIQVSIRVRDMAGNRGTGQDSIRFRPRPASTLDMRVDYLLKAKLGFRTGTIAVDERADILNRSESLITHVDLYLMPRAFGELQSGPSVKVDGEAVSGRWTNNANLRLRLPAPLAKGERLRLRLRFELVASGNVSTSLEARLAQARGLMTVGHWFATVAAGYPARYPGDALVSPTAERIVLELRHDAGLIVAAPGRLTDSTATTKRYVHAPARDFAFAVSPEYRRETAEVGGVLVEAYARERRGARAALESATLALQRFSDALGPYPWPRLVIAESPWREHGTEYSAFAMIGANRLEDRLTIAHEVAHQWFQALVGNDQYAEPWIDESVAEFISRLWFDRRAGFCSSRPLDATIFEYPNVHMPLLARECGSYFQTAYLKGQAMFYGLRKRMGEKALLGALRAVVREHSWGLLRGAQLRAILLREGAPRRYVDQFLRAW